MDESVCVGWLGPHLAVPRWCICADTDALDAGHTLAQGTACGGWVEWPVALERRLPTCPECLDLLALAREEAGWAEPLDSAGSGGAAGG
jgi:hypothetical protein